MHRKEGNRTEKRQKERKNSSNSRGRRRRERALKAGEAPPRRLGKTRAPQTLLQTQGPGGRPIPCLGTLMESVLGGDSACLDLCLNLNPDGQPLSPAPHPPPPPPPASPSRSLPRPSLASSRPAGQSPAGAGSPTCPCSPLQVGRGGAGAEDSGPASPGRDGAAEWHRRTWR